MANIVFFLLLLPGRWPTPLKNLTELCITKAGYPTDYHHGDVHHGFILEYDQHPGFSIPEIEGAVKEIIAADLPVAYKGRGACLYRGAYPPLPGPPPSRVKSTGRLKTSPSCPSSNTTRSSTSTYWWG